jgi:hypothetical protein
MEITLFCAMKIRLRCRWKHQKWRNWWKISRRRQSSQRKVRMNRKKVINARLCDFYRQIMFILYVRLIERLNFWLKTINNTTLNLYQEDIFSKNLNIKTYIPLITRINNRNGFFYRLLFLYYFWLIDLLFLLFTLYIYALS